MERASLLLAWVAGFLSFVSPCVLPMVPGYLAFISGVSLERLKAGNLRRQERFQLLITAVFFIFGFSLLFVGMGATATGIHSLLTAGRLAVLRSSTDALSLKFTAISAGELETLGFTEIFKIGFYEVAGVIVILFGLQMLGVFRIPFLQRTVQAIPLTRFATLPTWLRNPAAAVIGASFAVGWTPCVGPILASILTIAATKEQLLDGIVLLSFYSLGLAVPFFACALGVNYLFLALKKFGRFYRGIEIFSGALLIFLGALIFSNRLSTINQYFQFLNDWFNLTLWEEKLMGRQ